MNLEATCGEWSNIGKHEARNIQSLFNINNCDCEDQQKGKKVNNNYVNQWHVASSNTPSQYTGLLHIYGLHVHHT